MQFVSLQGLGEPLAHPHFEEIAAELEVPEPGGPSGHHHQRVAAVGPSLGAAEVPGDQRHSVSVNAATDRTHQIAMGSRPGTFDQVVKNIAHVLADLDWSGFLKASLVVTRHCLGGSPVSRPVREQVSGSSSSMRCCPW